MTVYPVLHDTYNERHMLSTSFFLATKPQMYRLFLVDLYIMHGECVVNLRYMFL